MLSRSLADVHRPARGYINIILNYKQVISQLTRFITGIEIHPGATVGKRVIDHGMGGRGEQRKSR